MKDFRMYLLFVRSNYLFFFNFIFKLYNIVLVLPNIEMITFLSICNLRQFLPIQWSG